MTFLCIVEAFHSLLCVLIAYCESISLSLHLSVLLVVALGSLVCDDFCVFVTFPHCVLVRCGT